MPLRCASAGFCFCQSVISQHERSSRFSFFRRACRVRRAHFSKNTQQRPRPQRADPSRPRAGGARGASAAAVAARAAEEARWRRDLVPWCFKSHFKRRRRRPRGARASRTTNTTTSRKSVERQRETRETDDREATAEQVFVRDRGPSETRRLWRLARGRAASRSVLAPRTVGRSEHGGRSWPQACWEHSEQRHPL